MSLSQAQLDMRKTGIGASEIAAVIGLNPYCSALEVWMEKTGRKAPFGGNEATGWGEKLEPLIADAYAERFRVELVELQDPHKTIRHPEYPWALASPDRLIVGDGAECGFSLGHKVAAGLEIKTAGRGTARDWGESGSEIPIAYQAQIVWSMMVTGIEQWNVAVLLCGNEMRTYSVRFDPILSAKLLSIGEDFWKNHVAADVRPEPDHSESARKMLGILFPEDTRPDLLEAGEAEEGLIQGLALAERQLAEDQKRADEIKNRLIAAIGDAPGVSGISGTVTYKANKNGRRSLRKKFKV